MSRRYRWWLAQTALLAALASTGFNSFAQQSNLKSPPIATKVDLSQEGIVAKFEFEVDDYQIYNFAIRFRYPENDEAEGDRIRKIIGGYRVDKDNKLLEPGLATPLTLTIAKSEANKNVLVYRKSLIPVLTSWGADAHSRGSASYTKAIGHCDLQPGKYIAILENLSHPKEYDSIPTYFLIGMDKFKTTFNKKEIDRNKTCPDKA